MTKCKPDLDNNDDKHTLNDKKPQICTSKLNKINNLPFPQLLEPIKVLVNERETKEIGINQASY